MSISKKKFSFHLLKLKPEIEKLVKRKRRKFYYGPYQHGKQGVEDLTQEVMLNLWMKVPDGYKEKKGELKSYCMTIADHFLSRYGYGLFKERKGVSLNLIQEEKLLEQNKAHAKLLNAISEECKKEEILFKIKLEDLSKNYKDFHVVKKVYECDGDRKLACKQLGISNPYITKICNRLKKKGVLNKKILVNESYGKCIVNI